MSANNWTNCPRCVAETHARIATQEAKVAALYGTVPVEEFDQERALIDQLRAATASHSIFREDYEIYGAEEGKITVSYGGQCVNCKLEVHFTHEVPFYPESEATNGRE